MRYLWTMDEEWNRLFISDKIRWSEYWDEKQKPPREPVKVNDQVNEPVYGVWSFSEALEIGASLAEIGALATSVA